MGTGIGKFLLWLGAVLLVVGGVFYGLEKFGIGKLPGDIVIRGKNSTVSIPIVTCIVVSIVVSLLLRFISRLRG